MYNYHIGLYLGMDFCTFTQSKNMADVSKENFGIGPQKFPVSQSHSRAKSLQVYRRSKGFKSKNFSRGLAPNYSPKGWNTGFHERAHHVLGRAQSFSSMNKIYLNQNQFSKYNPNTHFLTVKFTGTYVQAFWCLLLTLKVLNFWTFT